MDENQKITEKKHVSFSQFSWYIKCMYCWYLDNVKGLKQFEVTTNTCFGTAMHFVLQLYIKKLYTESLIEADSLDLNKLFKEAFDNELKDKNINYTDEEYNDFILDSENIINTFTNPTNRSKYFPINKYEFIDVELEINMPIKNNVEFVAYLDLVLKNKENNHIKIIDLKTSTMGWSQFSRLDFTKYSQLLLYKALYSQKYNIPLSQIDTEFFILKRKLYENVSYPQSRIQIFNPPNRDSDIVDTLKDFIEFINNSFTPDGNFIEDETKYYKTPGKGRKNCTYCIHKKIRCDQKCNLPD